MKRTLQKRGFATGGKGELAGHRGVGVARVRVAAHSPRPLLRVECSDW